MPKVLSSPIASRHKFFSNDLCLTEEEAKHRLIVERMACNKMADNGRPVRAILNYWSESSGECHCFPIFTSDSVQDVINRYSDLFPIELAQTIDEVSKIRETLHNTSGMSKYKTTMTKLKVPIILYRAIQYVDSDFWNVQRNINWISQIMSKLSPKGHK